MKKYNFDNIAAKYDKYYDSDIGKSIDEIEKNIIRKYLKRLKTVNIVEIGCGTGHWTQFLSELGFIIDASDISVKMINEATKKNINNAILSIKNSEQLSYENSSIENIIAVTSLEFIENQQKAINEIYRVLKPNGYFICAGLNLNSELGKNKSENEIYRNADFFTFNNLLKKLSIFGKAEISAGVVIENGKIYDNKYSDKEKLNNGAFIAAIVKKTD